MIIIVSGGCNGAEIAALRAARDHGYATHGWIASRHVLAADRATFALRSWGVAKSDFGFRPWAREPGHIEFGAAALANISGSTMTVWLGPRGSRKFDVIRSMCHGKHKAMLALIEMGSFDAAICKDMLTRRGIEVVNFAGDSEADQPGIESRVESFLGSVFSTISWEQIQCDTHSR